MTRRSLNTAGASEQRSPNEPAMARLMTPEEVSDYLTVPLGTLANWRYQGRGPAFVRLGKHVRYRARDLTDWIETQLTGKPT
jgi:excisionase family DNA binding protein